MTRKFDIAYSFAGQLRDVVVRLDAALQTHFPVARLFYDRRHEAAIAGADLDAKQYTIYREQAELVVVLISVDYARKNWTNAEGRAIRDVVLQQESERVVLLRFDQTPVRPIPDTAHFIDWHVTPLEQIVAHIAERHARIIADPPGPTDTRTPPLTRPRCKEFTSIGTLFKGREEAMARLRESLRKETAHATAIVAHQTIHGEGGVGKSRLAIEFGLAHQAEYSALLFVQADSPAALQANLANLAGPLVLNLPLSPDADINVKLAAVLRWLDTHPGWFLILDNVDTEEAARAVEDELARLRAGHVVITSRVSARSESVTPLELDVLDENDAVAFLLEATAPHGTQGRSLRDDDEDHARLLARDVDGLALALEQSAAYIRTTGTTIEKYRARWAAFDEKVRGWHDERLMKYPRSVATTWNASFDALPADAALLLRVCSLMAHAPIPIELLEHAADDLDEAMAPLLRFSLARREGDNVRVHRLIQEVVERRTTEEERTAALLIAGNVINKVMPEESPHTNIASWPLWERLALHVPTLAERLLAIGIGNAGLILSNLAQYLRTQARNAEAEPHMRRALEIDEASYGNDHPIVAIGLNNLAQLLKATNRLAEAEPLMRRALAIDEASYGNVDPNVAIRLNNLGLLLKATNRLAEAEPHMRRALAIDETSYGNDHPRVANDLNNLAQLLQATNRLAEAEPLMRRALAIDEASYGNDHPNVAIRLANLAASMYATNRLAEAEPLMRRALAIDEASYGNHHPKVANRLSNLAQLLQVTNRHAEAEPLIRRALAIDEASYSNNHPNVAIRLNNLAQLLQATNRLAEAETLMRRALAIDEASYGSDHPRVAIRLNNLANLLRSTNRLPDAEPLSKRQFEIFLKFTAATGHPHPHLNAAINNYGGLLLEMGVSKAEVDARIRKLFADHGVPIETLINES